MNNFFMPVGLICAFIVAWYTPETGQWFKQLGLIPWMIVIIFLINGLQTSIKEAPRDQTFIYSLIATGFISLLIAPFIGLATAELLALPAGVALGIIVKAAVPPTLSTCIVMTQITGGYAIWALMMTVVLNIIGVFTLPFILSFTLPSYGLEGFNALPLLQNLTLFVLLPLLVGMVLRKATHISPEHVMVKYLPSLCIILTVWMAMSDSQALFNQLTLMVLIKIACATMIIHFLLMLFASLCGRWLTLPQPARLAVLFTASQKTLPVAISVLTVLDLPIGEAVMACVLFHFLMLFVDALIAPKLKINQASA